MNKKIAIIGAGSAGAHWPGQEKAPHYLRQNGFIEQLESRGLQAWDLGDIPVSRFKPDKNNRSQQNLSEVLKVCDQVAEKVDKALRNKILPVVIGGDCSISLGAIKSYINYFENLGILYFDGHTDFNTPVTSKSGIFDSMVLAHAIGLTGSNKKLSHFGKRFPMIAEEKIVLFGYNPAEINRAEQDVLANSKVLKYPLPEIQGQIKRAASEAINYLENNTDRFLVHFDVDVIDFTDLPAADVPQFSRGMMFKEVQVSLALFVSSRKFGGLVITELNPDHMDNKGKDIKRFIKGLTKAFL